MKNNLAICSWSSLVEGDEGLYQLKNYSNACWLWSFIHYLYYFAILQTQHLIPLTDTSLHLLLGIKELNGSAFA